MAGNANPNDVQGILQDSLASVGLIRREGSSLSVASLPASIMTPKPYFKSKIPTPMAKNGGNSGRSTPVHHRSKSDLLRIQSPLPPPAVPPKPKMGQKPILRREISSPPSLNERRGSVDLKFKSASKIPQWKGSTEKISSWKGSSEKLNSVRGQIRKWESSASLEVRIFNSF